MELQRRVIVGTTAGPHLLITGGVHGDEFEPMAAITNAMNLAQKGVYKELQSITPGGIWEESFWVRVRGF